MTVLIFPRAGTEGGIKGEDLLTAPVDLQSLWGSDPLPHAIYHLYSLPFLVSQGTISMQMAFSYICYCMAG